MFVKTCICNDGVWGAAICTGDGGNFFVFFFLFFVCMGADGVVICITMYFISGYNIMSLT